MTPVSILMTTGQSRPLLPAASRKDDVTPPSEPAGIGSDWPAFNVADSAIVVGALLLVADILFAKRPQEQREQTASK